MANLFVTHPSVYRHLQMPWFCLGSDAKEIGHSLKFLPLLYTLASVCSSLSPFLRERATIATPLDRPVVTLRRQFKETLFNLIRSFYCPFTTHGLSSAVRIGGDFFWLIVIGHPWLIRALFWTDSRLDWAVDCLIARFALVAFPLSNRIQSTLELELLIVLLLWLWCFFNTQLRHQPNRLFLLTLSTFFCDSLQRFFSRCSDYPFPTPKIQFGIIWCSGLFLKCVFFITENWYWSINQSNTTTAWNTRLNFQNVKSTLEWSQFFVAKSSEYGFIVCLSRPINGFSNSQSRDGSGAVGYAGRTSPAVAAGFLVGQWCAAVENEDPSSRQKNQGTCEDQNGIYR